MLVGSSPVIFLVAPCVCAGAFMLRIPENRLWEALASVTAAVATLIQGLAMFTAMYYIGTLTVGAVISLNTLILHVFR